tara:strand:+ start:350 stop:1372 length:1023 start_codon:yes stop_codon:yes gene_type:complete
MSRQRIWNTDDFEEPRQEAVRSPEQTIRQSGDRNFTPSDSGLMNTAPVDKIFTFKEAKGSMRMNYKGADIVLGRDRPSNLASGYGGIGAMKAATIDLVVGRMASAREGQGPEEGAVVHNSFGADAARIYISQLTDIDKNFGIAKGKQDRNSKYASNGRASIAVKADHVRLIGREGIKIVTGPGQFGGFGRHGETNSRGGSLPTAGPIELIAGNNTEPRKLRPSMQARIDGVRAETIEVLQPLAKGWNLTDSLEEVADMIESLIGIVQNMTYRDTAFFAAVAASFPPPHPLFAAGTAANTMTLTTVLNGLHQLRINKQMWKLNYLEPIGYKYICSTNVSST